MTGGTAAWLPMVLGMGAASSWGSEKGSSFRGAGVSRKKKRKRKMVRESRRRNRK